MMCFLAGLLRAFHDRNQFRVWCRASGYRLFSEELVWLAATMQMEPIAYCGIVDAPLAFVIRRIRNSSAIAAIHCSGIFDLMLPSDRISVVSAGRVIRRGCRHPAQSCPIRHAQRGRGGRILPWNRHRFLRPAPQCGYALPRPGKRYSTWR